MARVYGFAPRGAYLSVLYMEVLGVGRGVGRNGGKGGQGPCFREGRRARSGGGGRGGGGGGGGVSGSGGGPGAGVVAGGAEREDAATRGRAPRARVVHLPRAAGPALTTRTRC